MAGSDAGWDSCLGTADTQHRKADWKHLIMNHFTSRGGEIHIFFLARYIRDFVNKGFCSQDKGSRELVHPPSTPRITGFILPSLLLCRLNHIEHVRRTCFLVLRPRGQRFLQSSNRLFMSENSEPSLSDL